ncbi:MAG: excinuclease ABC subunit UvrA [Akkermansiaceae bacterium]|nr:excinuclease ABC subunit UvrA [Akkermansiaceae bacterium]
MHASDGGYIHIRGAEENNLKGVSVDIPLGQMTVVTGPSGSGKTSLAMGTLYAEGQRRYMETFSPYVRQFMDRMDRPAVEAVENVPPAIALGQRNSVKNSRSTVGTMTGINEYLKLVFSRMAEGRDAEGRVVRPATPQGVAQELLREHAGADAAVCFGVVPVGSFEEMRVALEGQGYLRVWHAGEILRLEEADEARLGMERWVVVQDRLRLRPEGQGRLVEALENALRLGLSVAYVTLRGEGGEWQPLREYRSDWYPLEEPSPGLFSGNSPLGACPECKGYGRAISYDYSRGILPELSIAEGALKMLSSPTLSLCYSDFLAANKRFKAVREDVPWKKLSKREQEWVLQGNCGELDAWAASDRGLWYGYKGIFDDMEKHAHKMTVRVFLAYYRVYSVCPACGGGRLRPEALAYTIGGLSVPQVQALPMDELLVWVDAHVAPAVGEDRSLAQAVAELRSRVAYLCEVGLAYLSTSRLTRSLSGGEIERVSLTACLGAALTETLFVLDEPTVGLHSRDTARLVGAMRRLADRGNTLVVVEHEEAVMRAADYLVDMGPSSGSAGGELVYAGAPAGITHEPRSLTGQFLSGARRIPVPAKRRKPKGFLKIRGAECHNLHGLDADIPLGVYTCLTGVSGSGKSTLACQVLYGQAHPEALDDEEQVQLRRLAGLDKLQDVVLVDQSPIVRTPRSTPALYMKLFEEIRALFVQEPAAQARGLKPGYFSFNSGEGRCPRCSGLGMEKVEMQFLSDIFVPCAWCHGLRYTPQALSINLWGYNMAEILALDVKSARALFEKSQSAPARRVVAGLRLLQEVGLGHLTLGQPLNTLSGGENQRLKLARILADTLAEEGGKGSLLILDEPGTGLHFSDLEVLLAVFSSLVEQGHSLLVIEHNLDLIKAADYVIDLGPEGGAGGGCVVAAGTPEQVAAAGVGHTAGYLRRALAGEPQEAAAPAVRAQEPAAARVISLRGARHHQLKNIDVDIPLHEMTVVTGLSGSGKSTLAFDIVFAEGQKRFMDVMSPYARQFTEQMETPDMDALTGLPPTVAIEQNRSRGGSKSTVGTVTEIWQYLRLLYSKLGVAHCPKCGGVEVGRRSPAEIHAAVQQELTKRPKRLMLAAPVVRNRKGHYADLARWAAKKKFPYLVADGAVVAPEEFSPLDRYANHDVDVVLAVLSVEKNRITLNGRECDWDTLRECVDRALEMGDGFLRLIPGGEWARAFLLGTRLTCPSCGESYADPEPSTFSFNSPHGWCPTCMGHGVVSAVKLREDEERSSALEKELRYDREVEQALAKGEEECVCPACRGLRLNAFALGVTLFGKRITDMGLMDAEAALREVQSWTFSGREAEIARNVVAEIEPRLRFLQQVGLGYLSMDRSATTLSGGEIQRIRLAAQLGSNLRGVLYVLDEPTIGLHPRDNERLLATLAELKSRGNTLLVVEHDEDTMRCADHLIDLGPGAGVHGGRIVAQGSFEQVVSNPASITGRALARAEHHPSCGAWLPIRGVEWLELKGCSLHNLKAVDLRVPRARFTVVTGPSGAGKTSLITGSLGPAVRAALGAEVGRRTWKTSKGLDSVRALYQVDQSPLGKTPRSTPATYIGIFDEIRKLFAQSADARRLGFDAGRFSFNTSAGNCPECKGTGYRKQEMDFLPPCTVLCETCRGARYNSRTLQVRYKGKTIAEVLDMNMEEAAEFFENQPRLADPLRLLCETGLGYLTLGQASNTLSGGEAQRIKLVAELIKGRRAALSAIRRGRALPQDLYLIEEPTIGLHPQDVRLLVQVLRRLVELGNTVVVIEHNLELICEADYVIDMGPSAGAEGGRIVAQGTVRQVAAKESPTAPFIAQELRRARG